IAGYYGIPADPLQMAHELGLTGCFSGPEDLVRSAKRIGLKARLLRAQSIERLASAPLPAIIALSGSGFVVTAQRLPHDRYRIIDPTARRNLIESAERVSECWSGDIILLARRHGGAGVNPAVANLQWFLKSIWRYRRPLSQALIASLFIQLFALVA